MDMEKSVKKSVLFRALGAMTSVQNLCSPRTNRPVANQYEIRFEHGVVFQSYKTIIAVKYNGWLFLSDYHDYSNTTSKYATKWTGYNTAERHDGLKSGKFRQIIED